MTCRRLTPNHESFGGTVPRDIRAFRSDPGDFLLLFLKQKPKRGHVMYLSVCQDCGFGGVKENKSFCNKEACYSYLAKCIKNKALEEYLERNAVVRFAV